MFKLKFLFAHKMYIFLFALVLLIIIWMIPQPSNNKNWSKDQQTLSYADIEDNLVHIYNIRNFEYRSTTDYDIQYYDQTFDLNKIKNMYYIVEPFGEWEGAAHTFFSFEFEDDQYVSVSVEIRKQKGEEFSAIKGLFKQYELMYVVGDERDLIKLRTNYRKDPVYLYPANTSKEKVRQLFLGMLAKVNSLKNNPEFYNTLTSTCTTNLASHINKVTPGRVPFSFKLLTPGYSDKLAYDLDLIQKQGTFAETKKYYHINDRALEFADDPAFSQKIRN
ncbi:DUF4105 domain-containing protein [bacterium]|jgi:hypothetical protein|nr:DUF4105 domain-containing protein [bacterium]